jgi:hypothetical protein
MDDPIPSDIKRIAEGIAADMPSRVGPNTRLFAALVIARAILAERERCAKIAADLENEHSEIAMMSMNVGSREEHSAITATARRIAAAILNGDRQE